MGWDSVCELLLGLTVFIIGDSCVVITAFLGLFVSGGDDDKGVLLMYDV